jgi:hypothetical protein
MKVVAFIVAPFFETREESKKFQQRLSIPENRVRRKEGKKTGHATHMTQEETQRRMAVWSLAGSLVFHLRLGRWHLKPAFFNRGCRFLPRLLDGDV